MWWVSDAQDLGRLEDRVSFFYVEQSHVDRDENAITVVNRERRVNVPAAMVAALLLGPGTRITSAAVRLLADSGATICWIGEQGVRMYASSLSLAKGNQLAMRQAYLVSHPQRRLTVARHMYSLRFPGEDVSGLTMRQLRGREGQRVRKAYRYHAQRTGVSWRGRRYRHGDPLGGGDDVNRVLSAINACLYGVCHAAVAALGLSPGLGFIHTGSALAFVLDVADLYKAELSIPLAFDLTAAGQTSERAARIAFRDKVVAADLLSRIIDDVCGLLLPDRSKSDQAEESLGLWDDDGVVPGGLNWAGRLAKNLRQTGLIGITGPTIRSDSDESSASS